MRAGTGRRVKDHRRSLILAQARVRGTVGLVPKVAWLKCAKVVMFKGRELPLSMSLANSSFMPLSRVIMSTLTLQSKSS